MAELFCEMTVASHNILTKDRRLSTKDGGEIYGGENIVMEKT